MTSGKMGQKRDLTDTEKSKCFQCFSDGCNNLETAKLFRCDHRTIKGFIANSQLGCKKRMEKKDSN